MSTDSTSKNYSKDDMYKEIDLLQSCINRMARNSFLIKGWTVTLMVLFLGLGSDGKAWYYLLFIPVILIFWGLDSYYLNIERKYRHKYEWVIENRPKGDSEYLFDLRPGLNENLKGKDEENIGILKTAFSKTVCPLYIVSMTVIIMAVLFALI